MAYVVGLLSAEEEAELRRRGWDIEDAPAVDLDSGGHALGAQRMRMVWVDQDMFKIMDGPDWDKGSKSGLPPSNDGSDLETAIAEVLKSSSPLGHKIVSLLELKGITTDEARSLGALARQALQQHLTELANTFRSDGHNECGRALLLEANNLVSE